MFLKIITFRNSSNNNIKIYILIVITIITKCNNNPKMRVNKVIKLVLWIAVFLASAKGVG